MAIIYSYPLNDDIKPLDELVGTTEQSINGQLKTVTRNFLLQDLAEFFIVDGGLQKTIRLTTTGTSGEATLNQVTGVLNIPQYSVGSTITPSPLTRVNDTNVTLTLGGTPDTSLLQSVNLTLGWAGTLADSRIASASTWNAKQAALNGTGFVKSNAGVITYDTNSYYLASNPNGFIPLTALSSSATGLTYNNTTGVFSLTVGYSIPTTASQTNWNNAYTYRLAGITTNGTSGEATLINNILNIPQYSGGGGSQNLQQVTNVGNTTATTIVINPLVGTNGLNINTSYAEDEGISKAIKLTLNGETDGIDIQANGSSNALLISGNYSTNAISVYNSDVSFLSSNSAIGLIVSDSGNLEYGAYINNANGGAGIILYQNIGTAIAAGLGSSAKGLVIDSGTSSTGNFIELNKNGVNKFTINQQGEQSIVKIPGGLSTQYLMADGSVTTGSPSGGGSIPHATASGTDTYTATITGVASYSDGDAFLIRFPNGNTTGATLNINSLGARNLYRNNDGLLIGGDITSGGEMLCIYNTTLSGFQCIGTSPNSLFSYVKNDDSVTITKGMPVYAFSGTGDRMTVKRAKNTGDATSAQTVGLVLSTSIAAGQKGVIMMQGLLDGLSILPTATWTDGDPVYLGDTDGSITKVKPHAPNHLVYLGVVTTASNGSAGRMYVRVQNGYELDELHNVQAQTPSLKDTLWYDNTVSPAQWKTASISTILGYTPADDSNVVHKTGDETIAGFKTFTGGVDIPLPGNALRISSGQATALDVIGGNNANAIAKFTRVSGSIEVARIDNNGLKLQLETASTIASFDANKNVVSLPTATYPSLTELTYVKDVTSAIQTQFSSKQPINANLTSISSLSTSGGPFFVKVFGGNYFLDNAVGTQSAFTILANNTSASAAPTEQPFENLTNQTYSGTIVWTGTTAPSSTTQHTYSLSQIGNLVTLTINLSYAAAGNAITAVAVELPSTAPTPALPASVLTAGDVLNYGNGMLAVAKTIPTTNAAFCALRIKSTSPNVYEISVNRTSAAYRYAYITIQYFV